MFLRAAFSPSDLGRPPRLLLALVASLFLALAPGGRAADPAEVALRASDPRFLYEGRIDGRDPAAPVLAWQGSRVSIDFEGPLLVLAFTKADGKNFLDVHVDGQVWVAAVAEGGPSRVVFPLPLSQGRHHLSLHKRQEAAGGSFAFGGIGIAQGSRAWAPRTPAYSLKMEFYGDSITAGACDEDGPSDQWEDRRTHNGELSYAAVTGEAYHADWRNISVSGIGIVTGWIPVVAGQTWDKLYPTADSPAADLTLWTPDVLCVNLGDNDADYPKAHGLPFPGGFDAKYTELIRGIRNAYPKAEIVMLLGGMESAERGLGPRGRPARGSRPTHASLRLPALDPEPSPGFRPPHPGRRAHLLAPGPAFHGEVYPPMTWVFWALLSAAFAGITAILAKVGVENVNSNLATAIRTTVVLVITWAIVFASLPAGSVTVPSRRTLLFLVLSGIATGLSWLCYFRALQLGEASQVAPVDKLSVVFVILLAAIFLRERLTLQHAIGGALIVAGSLVLAWRQH
jgi:uncharacterized membrane protein/lysophospholipase L1-like esterase